MILWSVNVNFHSNVYIISNIFRLSLSRSPATGLEKLLWVLSICFVRLPETDNNTVSFCVFKQYDRQNRIAKLEIST